MRSKNARMVAEFRHHNHLPVQSFPNLPDSEALELHARLISEEAGETLAAIRDRDPVEILDGLADLAYIAYGLALHCGFDLDAAFAEVHRSNMSKLGDDGEPIYREDGKVLKGPNYSPPDLRKLAGVNPR